MKDKINAFIEVWLPLILLPISLLLYIEIDKKFNICIAYDIYVKILDSMITFISIVLGFVGVLIGILFSIRNTHLVKQLFRYKSREKLKRFFNEALLSGLIFILISIVMYMKNEFTITKYFMPSLWVGFLSYTIACDIRIINIVMNIVFFDDSDSKSEKDEMPKQEKENLRRKYKIDL